MKIIIREKNNGTNLKLRIPMALVNTSIRLAGVGLRISNNKTSNEVVSQLASIDSKELVRALKVLRKDYKGLVLVEVQSSDGDYVKIQV